MTIGLWTVSYNLLTKTELNKYLYDVNFHNYSGLDEIKECPKCNVKFTFVKVKNKDRLVTL